MRPRRRGGRRRGRGRLGGIGGLAGVAAAAWLALATGRAAGAPAAGEPPLEGQKAAAAASAGLGTDEWGHSTRVERSGPHLVWVSDRVLRHSLLFDGDTAEMLGAVDSGLGLASRPPYLAPSRHEVCVVETFYSRGQRGERFDQVAIYDARTLEVEAEVRIPPKTADTGQGVGLGAVLDGDRFLIVFNQTPSSSVSVVDLEQRRFVEEIVTGGCAAVYPVGPRRFGMLCGDGTALLVELDASGRRKRLVPGERFFDVVKDPVLPTGARDGERWIFTSYEGLVHEVDFSAKRPRAAEPWSLFSDGERADGWRVGGIQHLAFHRGSRRLFAVVHQGGPGTHKDAGSEIWVWDVDAHERVARFDAPNVLFGFVRPFLGVEKDGWLATLLRWALPSQGVHSIAVTQDAAPLLFARNTDLGAVGVLDARTGRHLRDLEEVGLSGTRMVVVP